MPKRTGVDSALAVNDGTGAWAVVLLERNEGRQWVDYR
jgi:hypothetical protein